MFTDSGLLGLTVDTNLFQELPAAQNTVLVRKRLTQLVKGGHAFPEPQKHSN